MNEIKVVRVPGAFEIPVVAARLACSDAAAVRDHLFRVILRITTLPSTSLKPSAARSQIQVLHEVPVIHEVSCWRTNSSAGSVVWAAPQSWRRRRTPLWRWRR
jgi:hypothetical protein